MLASYHSQMSSAFRVLLWLDCLSIVLRVQCPHTQHAPVYCDFDYMWQNN